MPGSLEPVSRLGKGCSSTWVLGKPVESDLRAALGREVRVENDADCFAVSEAVDGAGAGHNVVFAVILGSGAGAGIAVGGRAHHGPNNSGGEWGHNPLPFPDTTEIPGRPVLLRAAWLHGDLGLWPRLRGRVRATHRRAAEGDGDRRADARRRPAGAG